MDFDVVVIGGGAAGMMAAGRAAELGARVLLLEKNDELGKKLLISGGGRCNILNAELDQRTLLAKYGRAEPFLFSAFSQFGVEKSLDFFHARKVDTKVEPGKRVFPVTDRSSTVWQALVDHMRACGVTVQSHCEVAGREVGESRITGVRLRNKKLVTAGAYILATGGNSRPETGSSGDGFRWLATIGHTVETAHAALVPLAIQESWVTRLAGTTLPTIKIRVLQAAQKQFEAVGKLLFTHVGVSGPTILNMSRAVGELLDYGPVVLELDLVPLLAYDTLNVRLLELLSVHANKKIKNSLSEIIPAALIPLVLELAHIQGEKECNSISRTERTKLGHTLKHLPLTVRGLLGLEKAVVTSGGVALTEIDFKTMRSKLFPNLYIVGDLLNINRPSGGYSLQLCWTTGYLAGTHATAQAQTSHTSL